MKKISMFGIFFLAILLVTTCAMAQSIIYSVSSLVKPSSTNTITYTATDISGKYGAIIVQDISGGCTFSDGTTQLKTVLLSTSGNRATGIIKAPSSNANCVLTGYYQFSSDTTSTNFDSKVITVSSTSSSTGTTTDNTYLYIIGGIIALLVIVIIIKK